MTVTDHTKTDIVESSIERLVFEPFYPDDPKAPAAWSIDYVRPSRVRVFEEITPNSGGNTHAWKSFEHFKSASADPTAELSEITISTSVRAANDYGAAGGRVSDPYAGYQVWMFGECGRFDQDLPSYYAKRADGGFVPPPANLDVLRQTSLNVMLPYIRAEMSLVNSLIELKDFKSLGKYAKSLHVAMLSLYKLCKGAGRLSLRAAAETYLQYKFNFRPLLADIRGFVAAIRNAQKRVILLVANQGRPRTHHFRRVIEEGDTVGQDTAGSVSLDYYLGYQTTSSVKFYRSVLSMPAIFHAEIEYNYNYSNLQVQYAGLLATLDSLGVSLNPQIIWNAIPWSFVIDWVAGIGQFLSQFQSRALEPQLNIRRYLWSVTRRRNIYLTKDHTFNRRYTTQLLDTQRITMPAVLQTAYRRDVGMPTSSSITSSGLSSTEFTLGAALVYLKASNRRKRKGN